MPRVTLDQIRAVGDVTQSFRWQFVLLSAPTAVPFPSSADIDLRIETAELPKKTGSSVEVALKGHVVKYPGQYRPQGVLTFSFVETVDSVVATWLRDWQQACWNDNTGARATKAELQALIQIQLLNNDDTARWQYTMKGCFLEDSDPGQVDGSTPDPLKPQLIMSYDDFTQGPL
jgi:hypothetical protein